MESIKSDFLSKGVRCDGDLLLPDGIEKPPVVIMAHGMAGQKNFGLMAYAEQFVQNNMAVYLFDYRTFGDSDGLPRQIVDPFRHLEDWEAAVSHVRNFQEVDGHKIALWGSSFSGGHVLVTAARDKNISAVVSQVPYVSAASSSSTKKLSDIFLSTVFGAYDIIRTRFGLSPHYSPVVAHKGSFAAMNTDESYDGYMSIVGQDKTWENKMASRAFLKMSLYNPANSANKVKAPVLLVAAVEDSLIPFSAIKKCGVKIPNCEFVVLDCNHFAPYTGEIFAKHIDKQVAFLKENLLNAN